MTDTVIICLLGALTVVFGVGWYTTARAARQMMQIHHAMLKGMAYSVGGLPVPIPEEEDHDD